MTRTSSRAGLDRGAHQRTPADGNVVQAGFLLGVTFLRVALLGVGLLGVGCATLPLERSVSLGSPAAPAPPLDDVPVHGFVVEVELHDGMSFEGELLAVDEQYLWIDQYLETSGVASGRVRRILLDEVSEVDIQVHASDSAVVGLWTLGGALSTPSHGWFLVFSFPVWVITGSITSSIEGGTNDTSSESRRDHLRLYQYARFPQGIPDSYREQALASGDE